MLRIRRKKREQHPLVTALMERYPQYSEKEMTQLANLILKCIAEAITEGRSVTSFPEEVTTRMRRIAEQRTGVFTEASLGTTLSDILDPRKSFLDTAIATLQVKPPS